MTGFYKSKHCHYCGGEVDEGAMKCKHCGEWLVPPEERVTLTDSEQPSGVASKPKGNHGRGCLLAVVVALALALLAFFTMPSEKEHRQEIKSSITEMARDKAQETLKGESRAVSMLASLVLNSDAIVQTVLDQVLTIDIDNYGLFALGYVSQRGSDSKHLVSIALFGKIFLLSDYGDIMGNEPADGQEK